MHSGLITKLFPVPKYLDPSLVGVDVSGKSLKFVEFKEKRGKLIIEKFGEEFFPEGCIENGEVIDDANFIKILKNIKNKHNIKNIAVSLPEEKAFIFTISIPYVEPKKLRGSIELQMEGHIPVPVNTIEFDFNIIGYNKDSEEICVNISALPIQTINSYYEIFEKAGLIPLRFETDAQAIPRAIIPRNDVGTFLITDIGRTHTSFYIYSKGRIEFTSTIDFGGDTITNTIMKEKKVSYEEAEKSKIEDAYLLGGKKNEMFRIVISPLSVLRDEIKKYIQFWEGKMESKKIGKVDKIIFTGGGSNLKGANEFFSTYLEIPFELANPWTNIFIPKTEVPPVHHDESLKYSAAIGLALANHIKSNNND